MFEEMLAEICQENQIRLEALSEGWLMVLTKNEVSRRIIGRRFDLNLAAASGIAHDKYATYELLKAAKIPVVEHTLCYSPNWQAEYAKGRNSASFVEKYFDTHGGDIVLKPNSGWGGRNVWRIRQKTEIPEAMRKVFEEDDLACLNPFYVLKCEYRAIMLDGEAKLVYGKKRQESDFRFNLAAGAEVVDVDDDKRCEVVGLAEKVMKTIGLRFSAVDIVELEQTGELMIMEVNSGVTASKYLRQRPNDREKVKNLYKEAILRMFETENSEKHR